MNTCENRRVSPSSCRTRSWPSTRVGTVGCSRRASWCSPRRVAPPFWSRPLSAARLWGGGRGEGRGGRGRDSAKPLGGAGGGPAGGGPRQGRRRRPRRPAARRGGPRRPFGGAAGARRARVGGVYARGERPGGGRPSGGRGDEIPRRRTPLPGVVPHGTRRGARG